MTRVLPFAAIGAVLLALSGGQAQAIDCSIGYTQGQGGYYNAADRTGPYFVGLINGTCVATAISGAQSAAGLSQVDTVVQGAAAYRGGTIATASASQQLLAPNTARRGFSVQNQSTGDLYIKVGQAATLTNVSLRLAPGAYYESPGSHVSASVVNIIGATAGAAFYATEY